MVLLDVSYIKVKFTVENPVHAFHVHSLIFASLTFLHHHSFPVIIIICMQIHKLRVMCVCAPFKLEFQSKIFHTKCTTYQHHMKAKGITLNNTENISSIA